MTRTFLVYRYNTTRGELMSPNPLVVRAESAEAAANRFYRQALVIEVDHVGAAPAPEPVAEDSPGVRVPREDSEDSG